MDIVRGKHLLERQLRVDFDDQTFKPLSTVGFRNHFLSMQLRLNQFQMELHHPEASEGYKELECFD